MYTNRTRTPRALATLALAAALAAFGTGLLGHTAFADEAEPPAEPAVEQPAEDSQPQEADTPVEAEPIVTCTSLDYSQFGGNPDYDVNRTPLHTLGVDVTLTNDVQAAGKLLEGINAYRTENGVHALGMDLLLETSAYQRAAELTLLNANVRPDGTLFDTVDGYDIIFGEIAVTGNAEAELDPASVLEALKASPSGWMLLDASFISAGVSCAQDSAGNTYWVALFSVGTAPLDYAGTPAEKGEKTYEVRVASVNLTVANYGSSLSVEMGEQKAAPMPATTVGEMPCGTGTVAFTSALVNLASTDYIWNSSDPTVATAVDGVVTGVSEGTCTISAANVENVQFLYTTTVGDGIPQAAHDLADCTVTGILGSYVDTGAAQTPAFSVSDPNDMLVEPIHYTFEFTNNAAPGTATLTITAVEGSKVVEGSTTKTFEITPVQAPVPNVVGMYPDAAVAAIEANGLLPYLAEGDPAPDAASTGIVYATKPVGDTSADAGSMVKLYYYAAPVAEPTEDPIEDEQPGENGQEGTDEQAGAQEGEQTGGDQQASDPALPDATESTPEQGDVQPDGNEGTQEQENPADPAQDEPVQDDPAPIDLATAGAAVALEAAEWPFTGSAVEPAVTVTLADATVLTQDVDYTVTYANNVEPSTAETPATATVTGAGAYTGTLEASFTILEPVPADPAATDLAGAGFSIAPIEPMVLGDAPCEPAVFVLNESTALIQGTHYTVTYANNDAPGTATVTVAGVGEYGGVLTANFQVLGDLAAGGAIAPVVDQPYTGAAATPKPEVTFGALVLVEGTDYALTYANNVDASTQDAPATVTVTGLGNYTGVIEAPFAVKPASIREAQISPVASVEYTGFAATPEVAVTLGGLVLSNGTDYTVAYENNVNAGTAHVVVTGTGNYGDFIDTTFVIAPVNIAKATIVMPNMAYTGQALTPVPVSVTVGETALEQGVDYTVAGYANNVEPGDATATLQGTGNYTGTVAANWKVTGQGSSNVGEAATTQTLPATGDSTNTVGVAVAAVVGAALAIAAIVLIVRSKGSSRGTGRSPRASRSHQDDYDDYR